MAASPNAAVAPTHVAQHAAYMMQVPDMRGPRIVMVPESGISEAGLDALGRALSQHPRMLFFAVNISRRKEEHLQRSDWKPLQLLSSEHRSSVNLRGACKLLFSCFIHKALQHRRHLGRFC